MQIGPRKYHADRLWGRIINGTQYRFLNTENRIAVFRRSAEGAWIKVHQWRRTQETHWAVVSWDHGDSHQTLTDRDMVSLHRQADHWIDGNLGNIKHRLRYLGTGEFQEWDAARIEKLAEKMPINLLIMRCDKCDDDMGVHLWVIVKIHEDGPEVVACDRD